MSSPPPSPSAAPPPSSPSPAPSSPESETADSPPAAPLPMTASLHLSSLPQPATTALATAARAATKGSGEIPEKEMVKTAKDVTTTIVTIRLRPIASAPRLKRLVFKVASEKSFGAVMRFVGKRVGVETGMGRAGGGGGGGGEAGDGERDDVTTTAMDGRELGVWGYVNSVFAPGWDEGIGGLWACFKTDDQLVVGYSLTPAFG
ncbi:MAG: Ubiquitin-like protein [Piccolia ochrophora]|nr:MAG: Ubiquitin-like protein [Piccolia ochrophora]